MPSNHYPAHRDWQTVDTRVWSLHQADKSLFVIEESQKEVERRAAVSHFSATPNASEKGTFLFRRQDLGQRKNALLYNTHYQSLCISILWPVVGGLGESLSLSPLLPSPPCLHSPLLHFLHSPFFLFFPLSFFCFVFFSSLFLYIFLSTNIYWVPSVCWW